MQDKVCRGCGSEIKENENFCIKCGLKKMKMVIKTAIPTPLNYTPLMEILPEEDIIIYSTLCKLQIKGGEIGGRSYSPIKDPSHAIITNNGIALYDIIYKENSYHKWETIINYILDHFTIKLDPEKKFSDKMVCYIARNSSETKKEFKARKDSFGDIIEPLMLEGWNNFFIKQLKNSKISDEIKIKLEQIYDIFLKISNKKDKSKQLQKAVRLILKKGKPISS